MADFREELNFAGDQGMLETTKKYFNGLKVVQDANDLALQDLNDLFWDLNTENQQAISKLTKIIQYSNNQDLQDFIGGLSFDVMNDNDNIEFLSQLGNGSNNPYNSLGGLTDVMALGIDKDKKLHAWKRVDWEDFLRKQSQAILDAYYSENN